MNKPQADNLLHLDLQAASNMTKDEARFLVDAYYILQEDRKRAGNQIFAMGDNEPTAVLRGLFDVYSEAEKTIKIAMDVYSDNDDVGLWAKSILGIGPIISAGLLANIDIERSPYATNLWSFCGLANKVWKKGEKRPWNGRLKVLCWHIGECFSRVSKKPDAFYGKFFRQRKAQEWRKNIVGDFADQAKRTLEEKTYSKTTKAYKFYSGRYKPTDRTTASIESDFEKSILDTFELTKEYDGIQMLPPDHINQRSKRWATKIFLSHYHHVAWCIHMGKEPPKPFAIDKLNHLTFIKPPNFK